MKSTFFTFLTLIPFLALAQYEPLDLTKPVTFQFSQNISMRKSTNLNSLSAAIELMYVSPNEPHYDVLKGRVEIFPGKESSANGCLLKKENDRNTKEIKILSANEKGRVWTFRHIKTDLAPIDANEVKQSGQTVPGMPSISFGMVLMKQKDNFEIKDTSGNYLSLTCSEACLKYEQPLLISPFSCKPTEFSFQTRRILKAMGIEFPKVQRPTREGEARAIPQGGAS